MPSDTTVKQIAVKAAELRRADRNNNKKTKAAPPQAVQTIEQTPK